MYRYRYYHVDDNIVPVKDNKHPNHNTQRLWNTQTGHHIVLTNHHGMKFGCEGYTRTPRRIMRLGYRSLIIDRSPLEVCQYQTEKTTITITAKAPSKSMDPNPTARYKHSTLNCFDIFDTVEFGIDTIAHRLKAMAYLNRGLVINFYNFRDHDSETDAKQTFGFEGGISSYVEDLNQNKEALFTPPIDLKKSRELYEVEVAVQYVSTKYDEQIASFANNIPNSPRRNPLIWF